MKTARSSRHDNVPVKEFAGPEESPPCIAPRDLMGFAKPLMDQPKLRQRGTVRATRQTSTTGAHLASFQRRCSASAQALHYGSGRDALTRRMAA